jgi:hypothetical protein
MGGMNGPEDMLRTRAWDAWNGELGGEFKEMPGGHLTVGRCAGIPGPSCGSPSLAGAAVNVGAIVGSSLSGMRTNVSPLSMSSLLDFQRCTPALLK